MIADGPGARARAELCQDSDRLDLVIAKAADCSRTTVLRARHELEDLGIIEARDPELSTDAWRPGPTHQARKPDGLSPMQRALIEVEDSPQLSDFRLADKARCGSTTVRLARRYLEREQVIPVIPATERERRGKLELADLTRWQPLPPQPASMKTGLCVTHPDPSLWNRPHWDHAGRARAIAICQRCPALADCASWSLSLPTTERHMVYGAMTGKERARRKKAASALTWCCLARSVPAGQARPGVRATPSAKGWP